MRKTQKPPLECNDEKKQMLESIAKSRTGAFREVQRAKILLKYIAGESITEIARVLNTNRPLVERCINKALAFGIEKAMKDLSGRGVKAKITDDDRSWVLSLACQSPRALGYAQETWTYSLLKKHIREHCVKAGHANLLKIDKGVLHGILEKGKIKPHKINYYLEKRDEFFEEKMAEVLHVYKQVEITNKLNPSDRSITTISYDEKPGIQAISNIAPQLQPVVGGDHPTIQRDYEYKRLGTLSLLAGIDLHTGVVVPIVRDQHRSKEFIEFLEKLDETYPAGWLIRIVLDNHSSHVSKETLRYLKNKLGRFEFVFTPKHGSWLNMIEMFFSKLTRSILRHIRVKSKKELEERILKGIEEFNKEPVVFTWKYKMDEVELI